MESRFNIPDSWRELRLGEHRKKGDMFYQHGRWHLTSLLGQPLDINDPIVIRKISDDDIKEAIEVKPKKAFFNHLSLVPASLLRDAVHIFNHKTTSEKVQDYLKRIKNDEGEKNKI